MDALSCPVCRRRIAAGAAVCSLSCGAIFLATRQEAAEAAARPHLALVPPAAEVRGNGSDLSETQADRTNAA